MPTETGFFRNPCHRWLSTYQARNLLDRNTTISPLAPTSVLLRGLSTFLTIQPRCEAVMPFFTRLSNASPQLPVLIVNSDREIRWAFTERLTAKGYEVESAPDGKTCLERIQHQDFSVVLLSSHLPDQDGISLLTAIRFMHPRLPVIFMTAAGQSPIALERGAFAVLPLPCPADEFYDVVQ